MNSKIMLNLVFLESTGEKKMLEKSIKNIDLKYSPTWFIDILLDVSALLIQFSFPRDDLLINSFSWMLCLYCLKVVCVCVCIHSGLHRRQKDQRV